MALKDTIKGLVGKPERESEEQYDETYWLEYTDAKFQESKNFRSSNIERQWFINDAYYRGWHNVKYNKDTGKLSWGSKDPLDFQINQVYSICRAIRGAVTRTQPTWDVDALPYATVDPQTSQVLGQYLAFMYDKLRMKQLVKRAVLFGLLYGQGIFQYGYSAEEDDGEGLPWVQVLDPFDTYIDPYASSIADARYVVKVISRPKEIVEQNPVYDKEAVKELGTTSKTSESMYKELINTNTNDTTATGDNMLLHETWCVTKERIRVITTCEGKILRNELTDFKKIPFEIYTPDVNTGEIYGEGWVKNLVPLNKALNYLERAILEYNILFSKGKYITDSNSGIKIINNKNGQILRHKPGHNIQQMDMKPMSATPFKQIDNLKDYMQNIGAAHEAFMSKVPQGVTAGVAFDTLVANAYTNIVDLIDNLADCLSRLGEDILDISYDHQLITKPFRTETGDVYSVISGQVEEVPEGVVGIPRNPEVKVKITGGISHTKEGKREILTMLRGGGDISRQTLLQNFDIDPEEEKQRLMGEKMEMVEMAQAQEAMMAPQMGAPVEGMPPEMEQQIPPEEALAPRL